MKCEMDCVSRDKCGRPATHIWTDPKGRETPICDRCEINVFVCGGEIRPIQKNQTIAPSKPNQETAK